MAKSLWPEFEEGGCLFLGSPIVLLGGPGRVDVKVDGLLRVLELQVQKLCDEELRHRRHQSHTKVNDPFFEQKRRQVRRRLRCGISNQRRDHPPRSGVQPPSVFVASSLPDDGVVERRLPRPPTARGAGRPRATPHGWPVVVRLDPHGRCQPTRSRGHAHDKSTPKRETLRAAKNSTTLHSTPSLPFERFSDDANSCFFERDYFSKTHKILGPSGPECPRARPVQEASAGGGEEREGRGRGGGTIATIIIIISSSCRSWVGSFA